MPFRRAGAEFVGTFVLVMGGVGAAVIAGDKIGNLGIAFAFGLSLLAMAYAVGHISGGHFNPAVTIGLAVGGRFKAGDILPYVVAQVVGAIGAALLLLVIASGKPEFEVGRFAANGFGELSPAKYSLLACLVMTRTRLLLAAMFALQVLLLGGLGLAFEGGWQLRPRRFVMADCYALALVATLFGETADVRALARAVRAAIVALLVAGTGWQLGNLVWFVREPVGAGQNPGFGSR